MQCASYRGVDAIKAALLAGRAVGTGNNLISIQLIAAPKYVLIINTLDRDLGIDLLHAAIEAIQYEILIMRKIIFLLYRASISADGGIMNVVKPPRVVGATEENELQESLERFLNYYHR